MAFTPHVPPTSRTRDLSPRARALNGRVTETIEEFRRYYPDTTDGDIRRALEAAGTQHGGAPSRRAAIAFFLAGVVGAGVGGLSFSGGVPPDLPPSVLVSAGAVLAAVFIALGRLARRY